MSMKFNSINDFQSLIGGIDVNELEKIIAELLNFLGKNEISWLQGIELINDVIFLKKHDNSIFSQELSSSILEWIDINYDNELLLDFTSFTEGENSEEEKTVKRIELTLDTLYHLNDEENVLRFVTKRLKLAKTHSEKYELKEAEEYLKQRSQRKNTSTEKLDEVLKDKILERADRYFQEQYEKKEFYNLFCGLRETIVEHEESYSIFWCLKSEKYLSNYKKTKMVGGGALFISKTTDLIKMSGSAYRNWVEWFELEIYQQEIFWSLAISFDKKKISKLKMLLSLSTKEILKMVNKNNTIILEDEDKGELEYMNNRLNEYGIKSELTKKKRNKIKK